MGCRVVKGHTRCVAEWVSDKLGGPDFGNCQAIAVVDGVTLVAGIVFHEWRPEAGVIEVSAAADSPRWASRSILTELWAYPFDLIRVRMAYARMAESNTRARRLWRAFGANETAIPELRGVGEAEIIATLTREQWQKSRLFDG
jgi:hypothetical protein